MGREEAWAYIGLSCVWYAAFAKPLSEMRISREVAELGHGGDDEAGAAAPVMVVLLVAQVAHWGHGKVSVLDTQCAHTSPWFSSTCVVLLCPSINHILMTVLHLYS